MAILDDYKTVLIRLLAVMNRDQRLTGSLRGQTDKPLAPTGFELNNPWRVGHLASRPFTPKWMLTRPHRSNRESPRRARQTVQDAKEGRADVGRLDEAKVTKGCSYCHATEDGDNLNSARSIFSNFPQFHQQSGRPASFGTMCYICISARFLFSPSKSMHA